MPLEYTGLSVGARSKFTPSNSIHFLSGIDRAPSAPLHRELSLFELALRKIVQEKRLDWFSVQHAKTIQCIQKHQPVYLGDLMYLTGIQKTQQHAILETLSKKRFIQYNGSQYALMEEEQLLHKLLKETELSTK